MGAVRYRMRALVRSRWPGGVSVTVVGFTVFRPYVHHIGTRDDLVVPVGWALGAAIGLILLANLVAAVPAWRAMRTSPSRMLACA